MEVAAQEPSIQLVEQHDDCEPTWVFFGFFFNHSLQLLSIFGSPHKLMMSPKVHIVLKEIKLNHTKQGKAIKPDKIIH